MKTYNIEVKEILSRVIEVEAESIDEAFSIISEQYKNEEIVLDYSDFVDVDFINFDEEDSEIRS